MNTDFRALCTELLEVLENQWVGDERPDPEVVTRALVVVWLQELSAPTPPPVLVAFDAQGFDVPRICDRLNELVRRITERHENALRNEFNMRVPAEPYRDADLVLNTASSLLRKAVQPSTPAPVLVAERLPEAEDCAPWPNQPDVQDWCWAGACVDDCWEWHQRSPGIFKLFHSSFTHWLPHWALPTPPAELETAND